MLIPDVSSLSPVSALFPLAFVLVVSEIREFVEEYQAYNRDKETNSTKTHKIDKDGTVVAVPWSDLRVGDVVLVMDQEPIPADVVLLLSSHAENAKTGSVAYMETSNLDGETNLKTREAPKLVGKMVAAGSEFTTRRSKTSGSVHAAPSSSVYAISLSVPPAVTTEPDSSTAGVQQGSPVERMTVKRFATGINAEDSLGRLVSSMAMDFEAPHADMYKFKGTIAPLSNTEDEGFAEGLSINNMLLRGCKLRNTPWAVGMVTYAGYDSKAEMNSRAAGLHPSKHSTVENQQNAYVTWLVVLLVILCAIVTIVFSTEPSPEDEDFPWYLVGLSYQNPIINFLAFFVLLNTLIPMSLWVTLEILKLAQSFLIEWDNQFYDKERDLHARCNAKNMHEELGMVTHVFSDKTGTLTCNKMEFKGAAVGGKTYSLDFNAPAPGSVPDGKKCNAVFSGVLPTNLQLIGLLQQELHRDGVDSAMGQFLMCLALNHSCEHVAGGHIDPQHMAEEPAKILTGCIQLFNKKKKGQEQRGDDGDDSGRLGRGMMDGGAGGLNEGDAEEPDSYQGTSPDETALVGAAADFGIRFIDRTPEVEMVRLPDGTEKTWRLLHVVEFTSERRMMTVVATDNDTADTDDKPVYIYTKGADSSILPKCINNTSDDNMVRTHTKRMVARFAETGFRTLCVAYRTMSLSAWKSIQSEIDIAQTKVVERERLVSEIEAKKIEVNFTLLGCTAVEDKLQDGVPETIASLRNANITVCMITGDKRETAINIARSCRLVTSKQNVYTMMSQNNMFGGGNFVPIRSLQQLLEAKEPALGVNTPLEPGSLDEDGDPDESDMLLGPNPRAIWELTGEGQDIEDKIRNEQQAKRLVSRTASNTSRVASSPMRVASARGVSTPDGNSTTTEKFSLVIDGASLATILVNPTSRKKLLEVLTYGQCESAVFCRVNPKQKGEIVHLVRASLDKRGRVLAIGDGANDINMIHQAHVGVGIFGQEGYQAAGTADYAISRFGDLYRLMFYHGRINYERNTHFINFFIYKNFVYTLCQFWFGIVSYWTGQTVFESWYVLTYNSVFCLAPLFIAALFDKDIDPDLDAPAPKGCGRMPHPTGLTVDKCDVYREAVATTGNITFWLILLLITASCVLPIVGAAKLRGLTDHAYFSDQLQEMRASYKRKTRKENRESSYAYCNNSISTRAYTWLTFLPLCIVFQFRRLSNCYFLLTAVLAYVPDVGSLNPFASVAPLIFVLIVSVGREFIEEYQAYLRDKETNRGRCHVVVQGGRVVSRQWSDIYPGEIVLVKEWDQLPADVVLLLSSHAENAKTGSVAYMETSNLDGETNLKTREAPKLVGTVLAMSSTTRNSESGIIESDTVEESTGERRVALEGHNIVTDVASFALGFTAIPCQLSEDESAQELSLLVSSRLSIDFEAPTTDMMKFQGTLTVGDDNCEATERSQAITIDNV
ncbi:hypothetical protein Pmar_PMAR023603 [Perkinsus marinus ATCC 50983]|uniref:Uncharacterized protein n=1 Tax=Perkinsus marinus (strain ATCC 50983 / TXsc) TaxID=423536 RepID=C5KCT3_PERM5|nr:hypothetical protein Pmar_PMAR023603 [Perkinsus marinus ATCC 50983]EER17682.1 hypothetical protein Pmar_PMAR023603 [Perkinsus marinus ATCC 50983]|eukprot:XP_002785886.1 hypothetical protein Pmar_PMAR023603 [Perkinsus marinus ATCC 50983]